MDELGTVEGHAFISYVREDSGDADRLQQVLEAAGVRVWRDTSDLWPGEDWREKIRRAITDDALIFIACFSHNSVARKRSFQNEELTLAIEQLRLRRPGEPWLIPVRFDDCDILDLDIGNGRTLTSIQHADVFGDNMDEGTVRLVRAALRILGQHPDKAVAGDLVRSSRHEAGSDERVKALEAESRRVRAAILESARRESAETRDQPTTIVRATGRPFKPGRTMRGEAGRHFRIGMLGPRASGKTTYLAVLDFALARATDDWTIRGADAVADEFLNRRAMMLAERYFPELTADLDGLSFVLTGTVRTPSRWGRSSPREKTAELQLDLLDVPGEYTHIPDAEPDLSSHGLYQGLPENQFLDYLAACDGILVLFDPFMEDDRNYHYYDYLRRALLALSDRSHDRGSRLPHRVAVCVTKFDDPYVYRKAAVGGHIWLADLPNAMPRVKEGRERMFFRDLCTSANDADLVMALLEHYFHLDRIKYFVTSSIGFYISPATGRFDSSDSDNVLDRSGLPRIRGRVRPINVIDPLLWLVQQRLTR